MEVQDIRAFRNTLRRLERELDTQLQAGMQCCGVSLVQCHALLELEKQGETNLKALSGALQLDKSTVSRAVDTFVKNDLVSRETDPSNRRFVVLSLTPKGKEVCGKINRFCDDYYLELFRHIPGEKHEQVLESLALFTRALSEVKRPRLESRII